MLRGRAIAVGLLTWGVAGPACHVMVESDTARPVATEQVVHPEGAIAHRPTLAWTDSGSLRFVEPLECPTEQITRRHTTTEVEIRPNLATFTVGVLAAAIGGVMLTSGLFASRPAASPFTYAGAAGVAVGLPFAIGPWVGNHTELRELPRSPDRHGVGTSDDSNTAEASLRQPGPSVPCGERPLSAAAATLTVAGLEIRGAVDRDGVFSVSPYQWIDAFTTSAPIPAAVTASVEARGGLRTVEAVLDPAAIQDHAAGYLAHADFDPRVEPLKLVPGIPPGTLAVSLGSADGGPAIRVSLALRNDGPGEAWRLRGQISAPQTPAIDGRMIYVGKLGRGAVSRELIIPVTPAAAAALRGQIVELSVELRDAHGTAPTTPIRFRGRLANAPGASGDRP